MSEPHAAPLSRLGLGAAQFGLAYGITNARGQVAPGEVRRILELARDAGLAVIDTASTYGDSEAVLGQHHEAARSFRIVSKSPVLGPGHVSAAQAQSVLAALEWLRRTLRRERLDAFLVHHGDELLLPGGERVVELLRLAKARGEVERIGCSVYEPAELDAVLASFVPDLVQLPFNILDQRFAACGLLARLKSLGTEIHARSIFLQGTLLVPPADLPPALAAMRPTFERVAGFLAAHRLSPLAGCLGHALAQPEIDSIVLGVTGADELAAIIDAARRLRRELPDFAPLAASDPRVISPSRW